MIAKEKVKKLLQPIFYLLNLINRILPKTQNKIVLYSNRGFRDNVEVLYNYLIENNYNDKYTIICSLNDYKDYTDIKFDNVTFTSNYKGIFHFLTSKYFFYSFGKYPIKPSRGQMVVNLWHGSPLKKIGNLEIGKEHIDYNYFTYILATSDFFADVMKNAFTCTDEQIIINGNPRNDLLFKPLKESFDDQKKLIVWLPTHRNYEETEDVGLKGEGNIPLFSNHERMRQLDKYLKESDMHLIIKLHPAQDYEGSEPVEYENIKIWTHQELNHQNIELYRLLGSSDALITDYSSVYFDYLLLNKPIAFTVNDLEMYTNERGFVFDKPEDYMPGSKIKSIEQFYEFLDKVSNNIDEYKLERHSINELVNYYKDDKNCVRILDAVGVKK